MSIWKMSSSANQPVWVGSRLVARPSGTTGSRGPPRRAGTSPFRPSGSRRRAPARRAESSPQPDRRPRGRARRARARSARPRRRRAGSPCGRRRRCSRRARCARRSPRRTARAGSSRRARGWTWTTSAPRSSCACAIWPTVGNSSSVMTIRRRPLRSSGSAETTPLTPCETDVVTATSSGSARRAGRTPLVPPPRARPSAPIPRRGRPSRRDRPRRPRARRWRAPPASTS